MRSILLVMFCLILVGMLLITTWASLDRSMLDAGSELMTYPWFIATLADAYFGFLTFYAWVAYRETSGLKRVVWFILIMTLGNIAMAVYMLIQLMTWRSGQPADLLLRASTTPAR
ncbi:MAG: DUF1475 domain-containing protein [Planctomycetaceae bacterium]|nr:DUF1475 domain-containing protein [Planctomycetaceae bacterium]